MTFYYILWGGFLLLSLIVIFKGKYALPDRLLSVLILLIAYFVACRVDVGADWANYVHAYNYDMLLLDDINRIEPLYRLSRWIIYPLGLSHQGYFFILSTTSMLGLVWCFKRFKIQNLYLAFWCYVSTIFCSYQLNTLRSGLMAVLVWVAFAFLSNGERKKAIYTVLLSGGFHYGGLAFLPVIFFLDRTYNIRNVLVILGLSYIILISGIGVRIVENIPILAAVEQLALYTDSTRHEATGITLGSIFNLLVFLFCFIRYRNDYVSDSRLRIVLNAFLFCLVLVSALNAFSVIVSRLGQVLNLAICFIWPFIFSKIHKKYIRFLLVTPLIAYLYMYYNKAFHVDELVGYSTLVPFNFEFASLFR